ncbi:MAG: phage tail sheath family protein [Desulfobacteraceae bacterium]|nr:phage tail sheath family protein [Desulfobacteraceae bacterium]
MGATSDYLARSVFPPGVHFEEAAPEKRPAIQTGVPVFLGVGEISGTGGCGEVAAGRTEILRLTCWEQFEQCIRVGGSGGFLDYAVRGFFENGGEHCIVATIREVEDVNSLTQAFKGVFRDKGPLEDIEDVDLVCAPDIMRKELLISPNAVADIQQDMLAYCRRMGDRFSVLDTGLVHGSEEQYLKCPGAEYRRELVRHAMQWQGNLPHKGRPVEGAVYFPWIRVKPFPRHKHMASVRVPPCGHIAGIYARSDALFGVHKAPANEMVEGAMDLETHVSDENQVDLNESGVNCLRSFPGRGIRVWGARTLSGQPNWKYVNVRRLFLTLIRWIERNMDDLVFEPNGPLLWNRVRDRIGGYCYELYQRGALKGRSPGEAFSVKCDAETNPPDVREAGQLICEIGLAPVIPAEFIIVRITQSAVGTTVTIPTGT